MPGMLVVFIVGLLAFGCSSLPKVYEFHDPLTPAEHLALGVSYESEGKASLAIAEYKKVIQSDDHNQGVTARVFLGNVYAGLEQDQTAEQYYREALSLDPNRGQALNNLASIFVKQGTKLGEAEVLAQTALAEAELRNTAGQKGVYLETLGEVLLRQGRYVEALENFQKAESFKDKGKPYWAFQLYINMAHAYEKLGRMVEAEEARQRAEDFRELRGS
jgi:tetratricopeptide (TPR) repeat protein